MIYNLNDMYYNGYAIPMEFWKPVTDEMVPGVLPVYWISSIGNLYISDIGRFSNAKPKENDYIRVLLRMRDGSRKMTTIHKLVCMAFKGIPEDLTYEVDHINCDKSCSLENNLEWVTKKENNNRARNNNLIPTAEDHYKSILTNNEVMEICEMLQKGLNINYICKTMENKILPRQYAGGLQSIVYQILSGAIWKDISKNYTFYDYSRVHLSNEEIEYACSMMEKNKKYDDIIDGLDRNIDDHERERIKETLYTIKKGKSFKEISSKYNLKVTQTELLSKDESELIAKNVANNISFKDSLLMIERAKTNPKIKEAIYSIYRGKTKKDRVSYYKSLK